MRSSLSKLWRAAKYDNTTRIAGPWIVAAIIFLTFFKVFIEESGNDGLISGAVTILVSAFLLFIVLVLPFIIYVFLSRRAFIRKHRWHKPFIILGAATTPMLILMFVLPKSRGALFVHRPNIAAGILLSIFLFVSYVAFAIAYELLNKRNSPEPAYGEMKSAHTDSSTSQTSALQLKEIISILAAIATVGSLLYAVLRDVVSFGR
jgi:magnesium-transporting ATPase (P-type)